MEAAESALGYEGDGLVEDFDRIKRAVDRFEAAWDKGLTGSPFPFKDSEYYYFLSIHSYFKLQHWQALCYLLGGYIRSYDSHPCTLNINVIEYEI
jgi:hypothetical protein